MRFWKIKKRLSARVLILFVSFSGLCEVPSLAKELKERPKRVVTLAPSLGELAADLLGQEIERIVGVSEYTNYPPALKRVSSIGPYHKINLEKVVSLKPDLVLATTDGNSKDQVLQLREFGVPVVVVDTANFKEISESIRIVAEALGVSKLGVEMATQLRLGIDRIRERSKVNPPLKVMLQVGGSPIVVVGGKSFLDSALDVVGATNIYGEGNARYPRPSIEDVMKKNPDVIVVIAMGDNPAESKAMATKWSELPELKAVKSGRVYVLQSDALLRPSLRILEGLALLDRTLYGKK